MNHRDRTLTIGFLVLCLEWLGVAAAEPLNDADRFYDPASIQTIRLEIASGDLERLHRALPQLVAVPGTFQWETQATRRVEIRYRGGSSSMPQSPFKRSFLVTFQNSDPGGRFLGLRHVALDNGIQFGSLFSEPLITQVLRGVGVKASRCNFARVSLNGRPLGAYVNVERIDRSFLEHHYGSDDGILFKVDEGGPGADLQFIGADAAAYRKTFDLHLGKDVESYAALIEFIRAVNTPGVTTEDLGQRLDVEAFIKATAVMLFAGAFDQYTGWGAHNYYLYRNPVDFRWTYIPWDLDVGFADNAFGRVPVMDGWNAAWPVPVPGRPLMERLVADPVLLERYRKEARVILETWFRPEVLVPKLRRLYLQIRPVLDEEPFPPRRATVPSDSSYDDIVESIEAFIRRRYVLAKAQLGAPGPRPEAAPMRPGSDQQEPRPGPPSDDAPSDLRVARVSAAGVELKWVDHAEDEVAFVVQRCEGEDCTDFRNAVGQGGQDLTGATDPNVRPSATYRYRVYAVLPTPRGPRGTGVSDVITVTVPAAMPPKR